MDMPGAAIPRPKNQTNRTNFRSSTYLPSSTIPCHPPLLKLGNSSIPNPIQLAQPPSPQKKLTPPICSPFSPSFFSLSSLSSLLSLFYLSSLLLLFSLFHLSSLFSSPSKSANSFFHFHFHFLFPSSALTSHCLLLPPLPSSQSSYPLSDRYHPHPSPLVSSHRPRPLAKTHLQTVRQPELQEPETHIRLLPVSDAVTLTRMLLDMLLAAMVASLEEGRRGLGFGER